MGIWFPANQGLVLTSFTLGSSGDPSKNFHGVSIGPFSKILAVNRLHIWIRAIGDIITLSWQQLDVENNKLWNHHIVLGTIVFVLLKNFKNKLGTFAAL